MPHMRRINRCDGPASLRRQLPQLAAYFLQRGRLQAVATDRDVERGEQFSVFGYYQRFQLRRTHRPAAQSQAEDIDVVNIRPLLFAGCLVLSVSGPAAESCETVVALASETQETTVTNGRAGQAATLLDPGPGGPKIVRSVDPNVARPGGRSLGVGPTKLSLHHCNPTVAPVSENERRSYMSCGID